MQGQRAGKVCRRSPGEQLQSEPAQGLPWRSSGLGLPRFHAGWGGGEGAVLIAGQGTKLLRSVGPGLWEVLMARNQSSLREGKAQLLALGKDHCGETASDKRAGRRLEGLGGCWGYS